MSTISDLSPKVYETISSNLESRDVLNLSRTSKKMLAIVSESIFSNKDIPRDRVFVARNLDYISKSAISYLMQTFLNPDANGSSPALSKKRVDKVIDEFLMDVETKFFEYFAKVLSIDELKQLITLQSILNTKTYGEKFGESLAMLVLDAKEVFNGINEPLAANPLWTHFIIGQAKTDALKTPQTDERNKIIQNVLTKFGVIARIKKLRKIIFSKREEFLPPALLSSITESDKASFYKALGGKIIFKDLYERFNVALRIIDIKERIKNKTLILPDNLLNTVAKAEKSFVDKVINNTVRFHINLYLESVYDRFFAVKTEDLEDMQQISTPRLFISARNKIINIECCQITNMQEFESRAELGEVKKRIEDRRDQMIATNK